MRPLLWICYAAAFALSLAVFVLIYAYLWRFASYPIELEWREGSLWLHALAQSSGYNIFESEQLAYANANHGIFDHLIKATFVWAFPFVEPQIILRSFVLMFPAALLLALFVQNRRRGPTAAALLSSTCLSGAIVVLVHDVGHWMPCIGRSDSTAFTLLALAYLCYVDTATSRPARVLRHLSCLTIALVLSTNWKVYPLALTIPIIMAQRHAALRIPELVRVYLLILGYTLATCTLFVVGWFHADFTHYYRYFFGFFSAQSPLPPGSAPWQTLIFYVRTPAIPILILLSALPLFLEAWRHFFRRTGNWPRTLAALAVFLSLLVSVMALKMNFNAAGYWYLCPQVILLGVYYNARYDIGPGTAAVILIIGLGVLVRSDHLPLMKWYYRQLDETLPAARQYADELVRLDRAFGVYSEEAFLFKRSTPLPPIDMGDTVEILANASYFGPRFTGVFSAQRSRILAREPIVVFIGGCPSSAVRELAANEEYCLLFKSPTIAIGGAVYVRVDHIEEVQRFRRGANLR